MCCRTSLKPATTRRRELYAVAFLVPVVTFVRLTAFPDPDIVFTHTAVTPFSLAQQQEDSLGFVLYNGTDLGKPTSRASQIQPDGRNTTWEVGQ